MTESMACIARSCLPSFRAIRTLARATNTELFSGALIRIFSASSVLPSDSRTSALPAIASGNERSLSSERSYEARASSRLPLSRCAVARVAYGCASCC